MPSPTIAASAQAKPPSLRPMFLPELSAAFSAARSALDILKNDDGLADLLDELSSELRELVLEAADDWFSFGDGFECDDVLDRVNGIRERIERPSSPKPIVEAEASDTTDGKSPRSSDDESPPPSPPPSPEVPPPEAMESPPDNIDNGVLVRRSLCDMAYEDPTSLYDTADEDAASSYNMAYEDAAHSYAMSYEDPASSYGGPCATWRTRTPGPCAT